MAPEPRRPTLSQGVQVQGSIPTGMPGSHPVPALPQDRVAGSRAEGLPSWVVEVLLHPLAPQLPELCALCLDRSLPPAAGAPGKALSRQAVRCASLLAALCSWMGRLPRLGALCGAMLLRGCWD